jgi:predicted aspartyl protease
MLLAGAFASALAVASTAPAGPAGSPEPPPTELPAVTVAAPEPRYVAPTRRDRIGRIWAPVLIDGHGPFRLVLDTGASTSAVTQRIVDELGLPVDEDSIKLRGVTGTAIVSSVKVDMLEVGDLLVTGARLPVVADAFGGAEGVLGTEGLHDKRITIEFRKDRITIVRSRGQEAPPGFTTVPFRADRHGGMQVEARVGTVRTTALIDTGAQMSVGNLALREALTRRRKEVGELQEAIIGVTEDIQYASRVRIPTIVAGSLLVSGAHINFADLFIFGHWKLDTRPALLIGMDVLGVLDTLVIDYRRQELQIRTR